MKSIFADGMTRREADAGAGNGGFQAEASESDFTNEMVELYETGRGGSNGRPALRFLKSPSMVIFP